MLGLGLTHENVAQVRRSIGRGLGGLILRFVDFRFLPLDFDLPVNGLVVVPVARLIGSTFIEIDESGSRTVQNQCVSALGFGWTARCADVIACRSFNSQYDDTFVGQSQIL